MKYKTVNIPRPEWCQIGTAVMVKERKEVLYIRGWAGGMFPISLMDDNMKYQGSVVLSAIEPVPAWEPTPGEYVAAWDNSSDPFLIGIYEKTVDRAYKIRCAAAWKHIARITGVDCACSVEELKKRTDWL